MRVRKGEPRSQSALEFLTTYSFVFLIIAVVIVLLLMFSSIPKSTLPFSCNFYSGFQCSDASLSVNSSGSPVLLIEASDTEPGTVNISSFSAFLNFYNSKSGYCVPNVAQAGEVVYCVANLTGSATLGSVYSGTIKITANYCAPGPANITANCAKGSTYTYTGNIRVQATKFVLSNSYYLPVNITNNQSYAVPAHFQQMIQFLPHNYTVAESPDLGNIRFYYGGKELYSWCESNCSSSSAGVATFWVRTPQAIPPGQNMQIYMYFLPKSVQYDGVYAGEAPQLSPTYGEYDNGANVFNFYDNFAGTNLNTNKWINGGTGTNCGGAVVSGGGPGVTIDNGFSVSTNSGTYWAGVVSSIGFTPPIIFETDTASVGGVASGIAEATSNNLGAGMYFFNFWASGFADGTIDDGLGNLASPLISPGITGIAWISSSSEMVYHNYIATQETQTAYSLPSEVYPIIGIGDCSPSSSISVQWARTRAYPPNGVMPHAKFGTLTPE